MTLSLVTGGARSGKSRFAESRAHEAAAQAGSSVCFIATGVATDPEMEMRIRRHQVARDENWTTIETKEDVASVISRAECDVYLIDCLSLLLNNWMFYSSCTEEMFWDKLHTLIRVLEQSSATCIVVSNEIGLGLVPADPDSRRYRDWLGWMNQAVARVADSVFFVASGIAIDIKQLPGAVVVDSDDVISPHLHSESGE